MSFRMELRQWRLRFLKDAGFFRLLHLAHTLNELDPLIDAIDALPSRRVIELSDANSSSRRFMSVRRSSVLAEALLLLAGGCVEPTRCNIRVPIEQCY